MMKFKLTQTGTLNTLSHKIYYRDSLGNPISPFHDIPLKVGEDVYNMVVEIPRWTCAKYEIATEEKLNPIIQDTLKVGNERKLRYTPSLFPYHGYIWNYGAFPQTWEDPEHRDLRTGHGGDNDPLDILEIGDEVGYTGQVKQVKVLGVIALVDSGETDWKVMGIDIRDPLVGKLNNIGDVEVHKPGLLAATRDFLRNYKVAQGKVINKFGFDGQWKDKKFAKTLLEETNGFWEELVSRKKPEQIYTHNTTVRESPFFISTKEADTIIASKPPYNPDGPSQPPQVATFVKRTVSEPVCDL